MPPQFDQRCHDGSSFDAVRPLGPKLASTRPPRSSLGRICVIHNIGESKAGSDRLGSVQDQVTPLGRSPAGQIERAGVTSRSPGGGGLATAVISRELPIGRTRSSKSGC
jgi:hypothetical protein